MSLYIIEKDKRKCITTKKTKHEFFKENKIVFSNSLSNLRHTTKYKAKHKVIKKNCHSRSLSELYQLYKNIVSRMSSYRDNSTEGRTKKTTSKKLMISTKIDNLIYKNIKKNREKAEIEELRKSENEKKIKLNKKFLIEKNKLIRRMNAKNQVKCKSPKRFLKPEITINKPNLTVVNSPKSEARRRADLGLELIDMQKEIGLNKSMVDRKVVKSAKNSKPITKNITPRNILEIRNYMGRKKKIMKKELQRRLKAEM